MTSTSPTFFNGMTPFGAVLVNADGTGFKTVYTPAAKERVTALGVASDDTAARDILIAIQKGGVDYPILCVRVPIGAGTTGGAAPGVPAVDLLDGVQAPFLRRDENGNPYLELDNTCTIRMKVLVAVTAAKTLSLFGMSKT